MTPPKTVTVALRAEHIRYSYGRAEVLHGVSLTIDRGVVTAITGHNGSGKSTLLEILAGARDPQSGTVQRSGSVSLVVQRPDAPEQLPLTVGDVVAMGTWGRGRSRHPSVRRERIAASLERVGMTDLAGRGFTELSGGQRQRALLAQGLARESDILLLDEPAAGLDPESQATTRDILREEALAGRAVVCISHDETSITEADRVVALEHGRVVTD